MSNFKWTSLKYIDFLSCDNYYRPLTDYLPIFFLLYSDCRGGHFWPSSARLSPWFHIWPARCRVYPKHWWNQGIYCWWYWCIYKSFADWKDHVCSSQLFSATDTVAIIAKKFNVFLISYSCSISVTRKLECQWSTEFIKVDKRTCHTLQRISTEASGGYATDTFWIHNSCRGQ